MVFTDKQYTDELSNFKFWTLVLEMKHMKELKQEQVICENNQFGI